MSGKISTRTKYQLTVEEELFQAADKKIAKLNKLGVAQGRSDISEPPRQHLPVLVDLGDFENWLRVAESYVIDKRMKSGKEEYRGNIIEVEDILGNVTASSEVAKRCHSVMVLAPAGMGKTTLLRRIAQNARREKYKELKNKLVLMLDFRPHLKGRKIPPSQVLLGDMFSDWGSERMKQRYQWIIDNPEKVVFVMDSLDTLPFALEQDERPHPRNRPEYHKAATADVTLRDILAKDWFPESTIISSSREYKVRNLHPSFQPDRCILLDGLTEESVQDLIDGFLGKAKGEEVKNYIKTECPDVWSLLSIPVVLVFSMIGFTEDGFKPKTISGILIKFFLSLIRSSHAHVKDILTVLKKLMPLAFEGTRSLCFLFTPDFLTRFGLEPEEVTDLGILIPQSQGELLSTKLMQNDGFLLYFNHQTQQEALAALHALSLYLVKFKTFMEDEFWEQQFTVVRRFICGILFNDEVLEAAQELTEIPDVHEKKNILIRSLGVALEKPQQEDKNSKLLELFIILSECREGVTELIRSTVKTIDFSATPLSPSDVQAVAFVMKQCEYLEAVILDLCQLNDEKMNILLRTITPSNLKISFFDVGGNNFGRNGMFQLAKFLNHCKAERLAVNGCNLESKHLKGFLDGASDLKLTRFIVSLNKKLGPEGAYLLGKLVKNHEVKILDAGYGSIRGCESVEKFIQGLGDAKMDELNLRDSNEPPYTRSVLDLLPHVEKKLNLNLWEINESQRQELQQRLNEIGSPSLEVRIRHGGKSIYLKASLMESTSDTTGRACPSGVGDVKDASTEIQTDVEQDVAEDRIVTDDRIEAAASENADVDSTTEEIIADLSPTTNQLEVEADPESTTISAVGGDEQSAVETGAIAGGFPSDEPLQLDFQYSQLYADGKIGPEGGDLAVDESSLTIPPKSLADTRNLGISMSMKFKNLGLPADKVPISPYLDIKFCGKLRIPAIARIPTWFMPSEDSEHGIKIYKRYRDEENKFTWRELPNEVKVRDGIIEFEVDHFCGFIAMIKDLWHWARGEIRLSHGLLHCGENFLSVICYQSPVSLFQQIMEHLEKIGHKEIYSNRFVMKSSQDVPIRMECFDPHLHEFEPQQHLLTPSDVWANQQNQFPFLLQDLEEPQDAVKIKYIVNDFIAPFKVRLLHTKATSVVGVNVTGAGATVNIHAGDKGGDSTVINAPVGQLATGNANITNQGAGNNFVAGSQENTDRSVTAGKAIHGQSTSSSVGENITVHRTGT